MAATFDVNNIAHPAHYGASQTALLILDFHSMIVQRVGDSKGAAAVKTAASLRQWAKKMGVMVIHGLIDVDARCVPVSKLHAAMGSIGSMMKSAGLDKEPTELLDQSNGAEELHFTRLLGQISALSSSGIMPALKEKGVKSLVLCGLSTSGCVLRTAADACEKEFITTVIADGCADPEDEVHRVVTEKVLPMTAYVYSADEFMTGYEAKG